MKISSVVLASALLASSIAVADPLLDWTDLVRTRGWVTGALSSSKTDVMRGEADQLAVRIGGEPRVVYALTGHDVSLTEPVISRDGSRLAFAKIEGRTARKQKFLYVMPVSGGPLTRVAELEPPGVAVRGVHDRVANLAWSHDNTRLAYWGLFPDDPRQEDEAPLRLIDARTGEATIIGQYRRRPLGHGYLGPVLSDQAWAPDNRRLVYMNAAGELVILDVVTRTDTVIGAGGAATWSPDGRWIAAHPARRRRVRRRRVRGDGSGSPA